MFLWLLCSLAGLFILFMFCFVSASEKIIRPTITEQHRMFHLKLKEPLLFLKSFFFLDFRFHFGPNKSTRFQNEEMSLRLKWSPNNLPGTRIILGQIKNLAKPIGNSLINNPIRLDLTPKILTAKTTSRRSIRSISP